ncbi:MAG TPA: hypothetical protein PLL00_10845 [Bacteroidia bacterium]|nr:hypothetical protein [Bacteroidia bacterium]
MKKITFILVILLFTLSTTISAQTPLRESKVGHVFSIGLPDYMSKTVKLFGLFRLS